MNDRRERSAWKRRRNAARFAKIMTIGRFISILTDVHLTAITNDHWGETLRGCTLRFSRLAAGSAWHNNCTRSTRSSLVAVPDDLGDDRCRRDPLVVIIRTKSCRRMSRAPSHPQKRTAIVARRKSKRSGWFTLPELRGFAFSCPWCCDCNVSL